MRRRGGGHIVNVSSLGGRIGLPYQGMYSASKFALEGLSESLRHELAADRIRVAIVEPGDFRTGFTSARRITAQNSEAHRAAFAAALEVIARDEANGAEPRRFADVVARLLDSPSPPLRTTIGHAGQRFGAWLYAILPATIGERAIRSLYALRPGGP
jgi:NAD(P)-dependent dehydrogenase (short-subunit alcohol dehydrogenase family)